MEALLQIPLRPGQGRVARPLLDIGSAEARFAELLRCQEHRLAELVRRLLGWPAQAAEVEDVLQEVYLAAWVHRRRYRGEGPFSAWLYRIALHKARNHVRARRRRARLLDLMAFFGVPQSPPTAVRDRVRDAMTRLPHRDREVLVLRYLEQRDPASVAEALDISRDAVDARLSRARRRLRAFLEEEEKS